MNEGGKSMLRSTSISRKSFLRLFSTNARPRVIFSGIQPTGIPHLGNFLGAILNWVHLQRTAGPQDKLFFSIVGWHALTLPQDPVQLSRSRRDMLAILIASGLDPKRSVIFHQDENQDHVELGWILDCITPVGKLRRMTTWKSRLAESRNANSQSEVEESLLNTGLLTYPVLQAADVLAYKATHVPVGDDQTQHLELARELAVLFDRTFKAESRSSVFPLPSVLRTTAPKILSLTNPDKKMSKSNPNEKSRILLTDSPDVIHHKIRSAVTDSYRPMVFDPMERHGTSNLFTILASCRTALSTSSEAVDERTLENEFKDKGHGTLKDAVTEAVTELLRGPRQEFERLKKDPGYLKSVSEDGASRAREATLPVLREVRSRIGLV